MAGNRFTRPAAGAGDLGPTIDVLVPSYTSRPRATRKVLDDLITTEVPGLAFAFKREPVVLDLELRRLDSTRLDARIPLPDEAAALILKLEAWRTRQSGRDAVDVWRCCEVATAASVQYGDFDRSSQKLIRGRLPAEVEPRAGALTKAIVDYRNLSDEAGDRLHTRLRAIVARLAD